MINQTSGSLTLQNIVIDGNNVKATAPAILTQNSNTTFTMDSNSTIKNTSNTSSGHYSITLFRWRG